MKTIHIGVWVSLVKLTGGDLNITKTDPSSL